MTKATITNIYKVGDTIRVAVRIEIDEKSYDKEFFLSEARDENWLYDQIKYEISRLQSLEPKLNSLINTIKLGEIDPNILLAPIGSPIPENPGW